MMAKRKDTNTASLLEKAFLFLEKGQWNEADTCCNRVLKINPENAEAYLGKLMAEMQVNKRELLADCDGPFYDSTNYEQILRFGSEDLKTEVREYNMRIIARNDNSYQATIYQSALAAMQWADSENDYKALSRTFKGIGGFKDATSLAKQCSEMAEDCRKRVIYSSAKAKMIGEDVAPYEEAIELFQSISSWKDATAQIDACRNKINDIKTKKEKERIATEKAKRRGKRIRICAVLAFAIVLVTAIPNVIYYSAGRLIYAENYICAFESLTFLNGFNGSTEKASEIYELYETDKLKVAEIGDTILFGSYEQDNDASNGKEYVEWLVLDKQDDKILLISKNALDCQPYNSLDADVTWKTCTLRKWLNSTFLYDAFSTSEQSQILSTTVDPGNSTTDKVFLLSITEVETYLPSDDDRYCAPTAYACSQGVSTFPYKNESVGNCCWWLRTPGSEQGKASYMNFVVDISSGAKVSSNNNGIRPALWINLNS